MPVIELQIRSSTFLTMQRNVLRNLAVCPPPLPPVYGVQIVMDRIEFGNSSLRHNKPGNFVTVYDEDGELLPTPYQPTGFITQLAQDVTVYLTTQADILAHPNSVPTLVPFTVTLVYDLDFYPLDHECYLAAGIRDIEIGPQPNLPPTFDPMDLLPPDTEDQIKATLKQQLRLFAATGAVPVGLSALPEEMRFLNAGISVDTQMQFIAIRVQVGGGANMNADRPWTSFYKGHITDRLQGQDFAFYVDSLILTEKLKAEVYDNLPKNDNLETFPNCTYSYSEGKAILTIDVFIIYHIYRNYYLDIDFSVDADPKVAIELTVARPNELTIDFDFSHLLDSDDPLVNFALAFLNTLGLPIQQIMLAIAGQYILPELQKNVSSNCKKLSLTRIECSRNIPVPMAPGSLQTTLTKLQTFEDGLAFAGVINARDLTAAVISTDVNQFKITVPSISCGPASMALVAAFQSNPQGFGVLTAKGFIQNQGTAPMRLCNPITLLTGGGGGPFFPQNIRTDGNMAPFDIMINIAAPFADYYNQPYPLDILVKTSGGTRLLRFNPPPRITNEDYQRLAAGLLVKLGDCQQLVDEWSRLHHGYNPRWSPRPPGDGYVVRHQWEVVVSGLKTGERVALLNAQNQEIASGVSSGAPLRLMSVVAPGGERELSVKHIPRQSAVAAIGNMFRDTDDKQQEATIKGIEVRQTLLTFQGAMPLTGKCRKLVAIEMNERRCVAAVMEDKVMLYDFSTPDKPIAAKSWRVNGVRGVIGWQGGLLAYGDEGMEFLSSSRSELAPTHVCGHIKDVAVDRRHLYALTSEGIKVYSNKLCALATARLHHAESIITLGSKLIAGSKEGLTVMDTSDLQQSHKHSDYERVARLRLSFTNEPGLFVAEFEDGTAKSFTLTDGEPVVVAEFQQAPWLSDAVRLNDLMIKISEDKSILDLYKVGILETL